MEGQPLHLLIAQFHHPCLRGLIPNYPTHYLPTSRLRLRVQRRKPKQLAAVPSRRPSGSQTDAPGLVPNTVAALVLQLTVCSVLFLFPNRARALALPPPPGAAAVVEATQEEEDKEWDMGGCAAEVEDQDLRALGAPPERRATRLLPSILD